MTFFYPMLKRLKLPTNRVHRRMYRLKSQTVLWILCLPFGACMQNRKPITVDFRVQLLVLDSTKQPMPLASVLSEGVLLGKTDSKGRFTTVVKIRCSENSTIDIVPPTHHVSLIPEFLPVKCPWQARTLPFLKPVFAPTVVLKRLSGVANSDTLPGEIPILHEHAQSQEALLEKLEESKEGSSGASVLSDESSGKLIVGSKFREENLDNTSPTSEPSNLDPESFHGKKQNQIWNQKELAGDLSDTLGSNAPLQTPEHVNSFEKIEDSRLNSDSSLKLNSARKLMESDSNESQSREVETSLTRQSTSRDGDVVPDVVADAEGLHSLNDVNQLKKDSVSLKPLLKNKTPNARILEVFVLGPTGPLSNANVRFGVKSMQGLSPSHKSNAEGRTTLFVPNDNPFDTLLVSHECCGSQMFGKLGIKENTVSVRLDRFKALGVEVVQNVFGTERGLENVKFSKDGKVFDLSNFYGMAFLNSGFAQEKSTPQNFDFKVEDMLPRLGNVHLLQEQTKLTFQPEKAPVPRIGILEFTGDMIFDGNRLSQLPQSLQKFRSHFLGQLGQMTSWKPMVPFEVKRKVFQFGLSEDNFYRLGWSETPLEKEMDFLVAIYYDSQTLQIRAKLYDKFGKIKWRSKIEGPLVSKSPELLARKLNQRLLAKVPMEGIVTLNSDSNLDDESTEKTESKNKAKREITGQLGLGKQHGIELGDRLDLYGFDVNKGLSTNNMGLAVVIKIDIAKSEVSLTSLPEKNQNFFWAVKRSKQEETKLSKSQTISKEL